MRPKKLRELEEERSEMRLTITAWRNAAMAPLLLLALTFAACMQSPQAKSARYIAAGTKLLEKHDPARAILQFRNALKATPDDPEVYYQLGLATYATGDYSVAVAAFRKTIELYPSHRGAQLKLAQLMAATGNKELLQDAEGRLKALLEGNATSPEVLNTLAFAELSLGNTGSAIQRLDQVLAQFPDALGSSAMLASAKLSEQDAKGAEEILQKACNASPKSGDARRILGEFYTVQNRLADADAQLRNALQLEPNNGPARLDLARVQLYQGKKDDAEQNLTRLAAIEAYRSIHAVFLFQDGRRDEGIRELERLTKENPQDRSVRTNLVAAYRASKRVADADKLLERAIQDNPKDADALQQRGEVLIQAGKYADAATDLNRVLSLKPSEPAVHYLLARLSQARGATLTYRQELSETLQLNPNLLAVRVELAQSFLTNASGGRAALDLLDGAPQSQKDSTALLVERNWALWTLGNTAGMRKEIDRGLARERSPELLIQDGVWKLRAGDPSGARAAIEEALKINPTDLRALEALNQTYMAQHNSPMAVQKVKEYAASRPKSAAVQDFLGLLLMSQGDVQQARLAFTSAKAADPRYVNADLALAQTDIVQGNMDDAMKRLEGLLATNDDNITARLWLGIMKEKKGDPKTAIELYRKVAEARPDDAQASNNLAYLLAEYGGNADEALKYAQRAVQLVPQQPAYSDTLGWVLYRRGVYTSAIPYLERASSNDKAKNSAIWKYHLAMAYAKAGDRARSRTTLEKARKLNPNLPEAKLAQQVVDAIEP